MHTAKRKIKEKEKATGTTTHQATLKLQKRFFKNDASKKGTVHIHHRCQITDYGFHPKEVRLNPKEAFEWKEIR
jgi:plastocyanin